MCYTNKIDIVILDCGCLLDWSSFSINRSSTLKQTDKRKGRSLPAAVLITSLTLELVGREDGEYALLWAEVLPLYPWVGLQVVCKHCGQKRIYTFKSEGRIKTKVKDQMWKNTVENAKSTYGVLTILRVSLCLSSNITENHNLLQEGDLSSWDQSHDKISSKNADSKHIMVKCLDSTPPPLGFSADWMETTTDNLHVCVERHQTQTPPGPPFTIAPLLWNCPDLSGTSWMCEGKCQYQ